MTLINETVSRDASTRRTASLFIEGQPTVIFDTICTKDRIPWLATRDVHELLRTVWTEATAWCVGRYMIMPDHIHLFAAGTESSIAYKNWVQYWKSQFSKRHQSRNTAGKQMTGTPACDQPSNSKTSGPMSWRIQFARDWSRIRRLAVSRSDF